MAVSVEFTTFIKRRNSTKKPNHTTDVFMTMDCVYKEPTDVIRPTLRLKIARSMGDPHFLNYCYIPNFLRYYWVRNWRVLTNDQWECDLEEDFLASWKSVIGSERKYILRADKYADNTSARNGAIMDTMYPTMGSANVITSSDEGYNEHTANNAPFSTSNGTYVIGIIGAGTGSASMGAVTYYGMSTTQLNNFFNYLFGNSWFNTSTTEISDELVKAMVNPFQYIASAMYFPFDVTKLSGATYVNASDGIPFGWWTMQVSAYKLPYQPIYNSTRVSLEIPKHPAAATRGQYLNMAPYSKYMLRASSFGEFALDNGIIGPNTVFKADISTDLISGQSIMDSWTETAGGANVKPFPLQVTQTGVPIELAQITRDFIGSSMKNAYNNIALLGSNLLTGKGSFIENLLSGITSSAQATYSGTVERMGSNGSLANYSTIARYWQISLYYYSVAPDNITEIGAPCCEIRRVNEYSGYVLCADGHVANAELLEEKEAIERYMTTGFFYE